MQDYDSTVLQEAVDRLYSEARGIIVIDTLLGVAFGIGIAFALEYAVFKSGSIGIGYLFVVFLGGIIGLRVGSRRGWELRFRAQQLRLQMKIEENTRGAAAAGHSTVEPPRVSPSGGRGFWVIAGVGLILLSLTVMISQRNIQQSTASSSTLRQEFSTPAPARETPPPPARPRRLRDEVFSLSKFDQISVPGGDLRGFEFQIGASEIEPVLDFTFSVTGGERGVRAALFRAEDYDRYWSQPRIWQTEGPVSSGTCYKLLREGRYLVVFSNEHDRGSSKTVYLQNPLVRFKRAMD